MTTVEEFEKMAEAAQEDNAHVAVLTYYRDALDATGYSPNMASMLLTAVQYAQKLKKGADRKAVTNWGERALERMKPTDLESTINQEIVKLRIGGKENAATP